MFKGPVGPVSGRTSRSQAEKLGTTSEGFTNSPAYDPVAGVPTGQGFSTQTYKGLDMKPNPGTKPMDIPAPFTVGAK